MASGIQGPITSHPSYESRSADEIFQENRPRPRVRPEALDIADGHRGCVGYLMQLQGVQEAYWTAQNDMRKSQPEFRRQSRHPNREKTNDGKKEKKQEESSRTGSVTTSKSSSTSTSSSSSSSTSKTSSSRSSSATLVEEELITSCAINNCAQHYHTTTTVSYRQYLRAHEKTGPDMSVNQNRPITPILGGKRNQVRARVPLASASKEVNFIRRDINYVRANAHSAKLTHPRRSPSAECIACAQKRQMEQETSYNRGQIPNYIQRINDQRDKYEEMRLRNLPDPDIPEGHRKMNNNERLEALRLLKETQREIKEDICCLPSHIHLRSTRIKNTAAYLLDQLSQVEDAIKIFSRPIVFVKMDD